MVAFVAAQIQSMIESIRLVEAFVTAPLGLYSDLKMLRESLPYPEAAELPREMVAERRSEYGDLSDEPAHLVLAAIASIRDSLEIMEALPDDPDVKRLRAGWIDQAPPRPR